jgi:hypothetical protein
MALDPAASQIFSAPARDNVNGALIAASRLSQVLFPHNFLEKR